MYVHKLFFVDEICENLNAMKIYTLIVLYPLIKPLLDCVLDMITTVLILC